MIYLKQVEIKKNQISYLKTETTVSFVNKYNNKSYKINVRKNQTQIKLWSGNLKQDKKYTTTNDTQPSNLFS